MSELKRAVYCNECQTVDLYGADGLDDETAADEDLACRRCGHDRSAWVCEVLFDIERAKDQVPFQRVVNHEPEHARRIAVLERSGKETLESLKGIWDTLNRSDRDINSCNRTVKALTLRLAAVEGIQEAQKHGQNTLIEDVRDLNTRVRGLETSSVHNESPLNRITRLENGRKVLVDRVEGLKETFDGAYTNAMSKVEELEWALEKVKKQDLAPCDRAAHDEVLNRLRDLEQQFGVLQDQAVEFDGQTAKQIDRIDSHAQGLEQEVWKKLEAIDERVQKQKELLDHFVERTHDLEVELRTKLSQHLKQADTGYDELNKRLDELAELRREARRDKEVDEKESDDEIVMPATAAADAHELIYFLFLEQFPKVTDKDYDLMAHAVGADSVPPFQRNYFSASPSSANDERWAYLCDEGLAVITREPVETMFPDRLYSLTREGIAFVLAWRATKRPPTD